MTEFDIIARYFAPLTSGKEVLDNDTATLQIPAKHELVVSTDTLNADVHFFSNAAPADIARKALRSNLSDLTASGAKPLCYQLAIAFPDTPDEAWLAAFTGALLEEQKLSGIYCSGGDTTSTKGPLSLTITAMGYVREGETVRRDGAQIGDVAIITGVVGAGYEAYKAGEIYVPEARSAVAAIVAGYAHAAVDVSDGLLADAGHIARASGVDLMLRADDIPYDGDLLEAVTGGDDYEIVMAVPADKAMVCLQGLSARGCCPAIIGEFRKGDGQVRLLDGQGSDITPEKAGWDHF